MLALKPFRRTTRGLPDYLNWSHVIAPGVVLNKDGSLLAGRYIQGNNLAHADDTAWDFASEAANRAMCKLGGSWAVWVDTVRLPVSRFTDPAENHFPCAIPEMIEAERRADFTAEGACFESDYVVILHYTPPLKTKSAIVNLVYEQDSADKRPAAASAILTGFQKALDEFDDQLSAAVRVRPMQDRRWSDVHGKPQLRSELVNYLYFTVTGELIDIALPPHGAYLDGIIGEQPVFPGNMPKVGDQFVAVISIAGYPFPSATTPGILAGLDLLAFPLRFSTRYIVLDPGEAEKQGKIIETKWRQKARGWKGIFFDDAQENPDAAKMAVEAAAATERTQSALEGTGYYTAVIVLMDESTAVLEENARAVRRTLRDAGFPSRLETFNAMDAFIGSLSGHCIPNVRRPPIHTTNLADLLPLASPWQGHEHNPCPMYPAKSPPLMQAVTAGSTPMNINFHVGDVGHVIGFGPIGSGKSTWLSTTAMSAVRYQGFR
jgi:type IV secretory pathway VirB4 component